MKRKLKGELRLQLKRGSTWFFFLLEIIVAIVAALLTRNELKFLIEENLIADSYEYPPFINSALLMTLLFGGTLTILWGVMMVQYDEHHKCKMIRCCTTSWTSVLLAKVIFGLLFSGAISMFTFAVGLISQGIWNASNAQAVVWVKENAVQSTIAKVICLCIILWVTSMVGMIIGNIIRNPSISMIVSILFDQFILARTPLYNSFVYRVFQDSVLRTASTPPPEMSDVPILVIYTMVLLIISILISLVVTTAKFVRHT